MSEPVKATEKKKEGPKTSHANDVTKRGFFVKLILMMLIDALGLYGVFTAYMVKSWIVLGVLAALLIVVNWIYFSKRMIPAKYLVPGMVFLLIYQVFVMGYTGYVSFTNYGQGHNSTKEDAISAILKASEQRAPGAVNVTAAVVEDGSGLGLVIADPTTGALKEGNPDTPLRDVQGTVSAGMISDVQGYKVLKVADILNRQTDVAGLTVPVSSDPNDGYYKTDDGATAYLAKSTYAYDAQADTLTDTATGTVYTADNKAGVFVDSAGNELTPGWRVFVGFSNYKNMVTSNDLGGPFLKALLWSFIFAAASVLSTFALGLILGLVFAGGGSSQVRDLSGQVEGRRGRGELRITLIGRIGVLGEQVEEERGCVVFGTDRANMHDPGASRQRRSQEPALVVKDGPPSLTRIVEEDSSARGILPETACAEVGEKIGAQGAGA